MIDQLEVANIIVLNKIDLVTKKNLNIVMANLKAINPDSEIIPTNFSKVDLKSVVLEQYLAWQKMPIMILGMIR